MGHLLDTSVLTRLGSPAIYKAVEQRAVIAGESARCVVSDLEVGFSARNAGEWDMLNRAVRIHAPVLVLPQDFSRALGIQRALAECGLKGRKVSDLLIAAAAEREGLVLLHYNKDFDFISEVTGQPCEWVVPRGSID